MPWRRALALPRVTIPSWVERTLVLVLGVSSLAVAMQLFAGSLWFQGVVFLVISFSFVAMNWLLDAVFEQGWMAATLSADRQLAGRLDPLDRDRVLAHQGLNRPRSRRYGMDLTQMMHDIEDMDEPALHGVAEMIRDHAPRR